MAENISALSRQVSHDLSPRTTGARTHQARVAEVPIMPARAQQEWLGPDFQKNRSGSAPDPSASAPIRLVGRKILENSAASTPVAADRAIVAPSTLPVPALLDTHFVQARRAIGLFSQQLTGNVAFKGTQINTYA